MTDSIREQALANMVLIFGAMQADLPSDDPYTITFDQVQRNPLNELSWKKRLSLGIHDTMESVKAQPGIKMRELSVVLEFRRVLDTDEVASTAGSEIMTNIQRCLAVNFTLGGTVIDVAEASNELYIEGFDQRQLSGAVFLKVLYRTAQDDPRRSR